MTTTSKVANPFLTDGNPMYIGHEQATFKIFDRPFSRTIWSMKYRVGDEANIFETFERVCDGAFALDPNNIYRPWCEWAMQAGLLMPGGRVLASAGTSRRTTSINCYVSQTIEDSMVGIMRALSEAALTQQMGGGIGMDFSTLRPNRAQLRRTGEGSAASGPLPFMDMWNSMCQTIMSAGSRRGAMMATICDHHPDMPTFIKAKETKGRLTNFNVSVLVSDAFMSAVMDDEEWDLYFHIPPVGKRPQELVDADFQDDDNVTQYVYERWRARKLWDMITEYTYANSEPGIIFIDRVNDLNNLNYCEDIQCTNPCGEQPLPPYGCCNLGAVNLARMVTNPYSKSPLFNWTVLRKVVSLGVHLLDNVADSALYPLEEQRAEEQNKRRIGLGISGLADCLSQLGMRYGSNEAIEFVNKVMAEIMETAYETSCDIVSEGKSAFPLFNADGYLATGTFASERLTVDLQERIRLNGLRNALLLTVAPTGTTSIVFGDVSSGLEPTFAHTGQRKVLQNDGSWKLEDTKGYGLALLEHVTGETSPRSHMVVADDLRVYEHILMQAAVQRYVDASVSKTINCPETISLEEFRSVYDLAYKSGCKGCTTYRPSEVRGAVLLKEATPDPKAKVPTVSPLRGRPDILSGKTYKIKWPHKPAALYMTVNHDETGEPFEIFITSKDAGSQEWITALTLMITAIFRKGGDVSFVAQELKQIQSFHDSAWIGSIYYGSLPAYIGHVLDNHLRGQPAPALPASAVVEPAVISTRPQPTRAEVCPSCGSPTLTRQEGCKKCTNCGYSSC